MRLPPAVSSRLALVRLFNSEMFFEDKELALLEAELREAPAVRDRDTPNESNGNRNRTKNWGAQAFFGALPPHSPPKTCGFPWAAVDKPSFRRNMRFLGCIFLLCLPNEWERSSLPEFIGLTSHFWIRTWLHTKKWWLLLVKYQSAQEVRGNHTCDGTMNSFGVCFPSAEPSDFL